MVISTYDFWYDRQQVRFIEQVIRGFSGFQYQTGSIAGAPPQTLMVPCRMASSSRMVANIMNNATENTLLSVPLITVYQTGLRGRRADLQNPAFVNTKQVFERSYSNGQYGATVGNTYTINQAMPMPFTMELKVDLWTSNLEQKYQLMEQMLAICYPEFQIQSSDNALDWTAITICYVDDEIGFTTQTIPIGNDNAIDVFTLNLKIPMWLSVPAQVQQMARIEEVVANVGLGELVLDGSLTVDGLNTNIATGGPMATAIVTPNEAFISVSGNTVTLLASRTATLLPNGQAPAWSDLIAKYGQTLQPTISSLQLIAAPTFASGLGAGAFAAGNFVAGALQHTAAASDLFMTVDATTLPVNTLSPINGIINPLVTFPGCNQVPFLAAPMPGDSYIILYDVGHSRAWGDLTARMNDIITFDGSKWSVSFPSLGAPPQFVVNTYTTRQLKWTGTEWVVALDGIYGPGQWRLVF